MTNEDCIKRRMETSMAKYSPDLLLTAVLGKGNTTTSDTKHGKTMPTWEDPTAKHPEGPL